MVTPIAPKEPAKPPTSPPVSPTENTKEPTQTTTFESPEDRFIRNLTGGLLFSGGGPLIWAGKTISDWKNSFNKEPETN
jgi:hypothetical protein